MFVEEARWIYTKIEEMSKSFEAVIDVGGSTEKFRTIIQPHIYEQVYKPIEERGGKITVADIKSGKGIDISIDLSNKEITVLKKKYDLILCCNILEHVIDRQAFIANLCKFTSPGSVLLFTVPRVYMIHKDPIDTYYRPSIEKLHEDIEKHISFKVITSEIITIHDKKYYEFRGGGRLDYVLLRGLRRRLRFYIPFLRWKVTCTIIKVSNYK